MTIMCRIKKALGVQSPSMYEFCKLKLNAQNKEKCKKCKYFKISQYTAYEIGEVLNNGLQSSIESMKKFAEAIRKF